MFLAVLAALAWSDAGVAQGGKGSAKPKIVKAKIGKEARTALAAAGRLSRVRQGSSVVERQKILEKAQAAFAKVARKFASQDAVVGEAAFRRGQLLGRLGRINEALAAFRRAGDKAKAGFGTRARLEAGHVQRREKLYPDALESYRLAATAGGAYGNRARLWIGKTLINLGRVPDARREWQALGTDRTMDAYLRIQAFDDLAMSYVKEKKIGAAKRVIADAEDALSSETAGEDKRARVLRKKLGRMRARKSIAKAAERALESRRR
ncbi:MAG: hypothetical protein CMJ85_04510 [Planctomycetes bacterium]|nr:hypothetical protein [Planctomycetota bacterium]MDP6424533.1 hypothetical protein [Planctomycetota bacterium]